MSLDLTPSDRRLLMTAAGVLLVLIAGSLVLTGGSDDTADVPSTYSTGSRGAKAAYLLLQSSGYQVDRWEQPLNELPDAGRLTLLLAEPDGAPSADERVALRQFLERGGRVIATGMFGASFLPEHDALPDPLAGMTWKRMTSQSPSAITRAAPEITLAPQAHWKPGPYAVPLYGDDGRDRKLTATSGRHTVVTYPVAGGDVIWWASATPLTNAGIQETGNLEFFLACVSADRSRTILWDEYWHGHRRSLADSAMLGPVKWMFVQLGVLALAVLLTYSRRSGPIVLPAADRRLSPLEFVRTLGSLYERAGAASVAVDISYQRLRYWLTRRLGMSGSASADEIDRAVRERWSHADPTLGDTLRACEAARNDVHLPARQALALNQSLYEAAAKLERLGLRRKE